MRTDTSVIPPEIVIDDLTRTVDLRARLEKRQVCVAAGNRMYCPPGTE
jgi:hypothetical protein